MTNLIVGHAQSDEKRMTSLQIAETTGKNHRDVMRAIRKMEPAWVKIGERNFAQTSYKDSQGKEQPCYSLTQEECLYIATKFNDEARAKLIKRWKELEVKERTGGTIVPKSFKEALFLAYQQQEEIERQQKLLEVQNAVIEEKDNRLNVAREIYKEERPLVNYSKGVLAEEELMEVHTLGKMLSNIKELDMGPKKIFKWLRDHKYIRPNSTEPYQEYINKKRWFVYKENQVRNMFGFGTHVESKTFFTPAGRIEIANQMYQEKGIEAPRQLELKFD